MKNRRGRAAVTGPWTPPEDDPMRVEMPLPLLGREGRHVLPEPENLPLLLCPCLRGHSTSGSGPCDLTRLPVDIASPHRTLARRLSLGVAPRDSELESRS